MAAQPNRSGPCTRVDYRFMEIENGANDNGKDRLDSGNKLGNRRLNKTTIISTELIL